MGFPSRHSFKKWPKTRPRPSSSGSYVSKAKHKLCHPSRSCVETNEQVVIVSGSKDTETITLLQRIKPYQSNNPTTTKFPKLTTIYLYFIHKHICIWICKCGTCGNGLVVSVPCLALCTLISCLFQKGKVCGIITSSLFPSFPKRTLTL